MEIIIENAHSPVWDDEANTSITLFIKLASLENEIPFTASESDVEEHGRDIYARALAGEFGEILPYTAPTVEELAAIESPRNRDAEMLRAKQKVEHYNLLDDTESMQMWKMYYQELNGLVYTEMWPVVDIWPIAPSE